MRSSKHCTSLFYLQPFFLICVISLCTAWDISSQHDANKQCAEIYFRPSFQGPYIQLKDDEQISDLTDIRHHFNKDISSQNETVQQQEENDINEETAAPQDTVSFRIQNGCKLKVSPNKFLKDEVHGFTEQLDAMRWFTPNSVSCACPKMCNCESIQLRRSECARAYLNDDCSNCKALFTTMRPDDDWKQFPEVWSPIVNSIVIRPGCDVSLRHAHTANKVQTLSSSTSRIVGNVQQMGNITQYHCKCSENAAPSPRGGSTAEANANYPPLINIPRSKGGINTLLFKDELKTHPGLMAALQSLRNKRISKNAYILLLGMTGSGKSSAVNLLFDHPNITKTGDFVSTTSDILEFTIPVPIPELGMGNTALHVIDTPGIGDTRGLTEDARFLASLEDFLSKHEDLKRNLPNVVLIFTKFSDNRYRGDGASFVKMLRTLDLFKNRIIDKRSTNVIFVLTHYMSETKDITRDPSERIQSIRQVIQEFSTLPRPIHIVLAENKAEENHLPSINGFYQLPNGEFYPKNLFDQMQRNLNGDPVGESVIRSAFSNSDDFQITGKRHRLLHRSNAKVTRYLGMLASLNTPVTGTEVSAELDKSYEQLDSTLKSRYPNALNTLQRSLYLRNIILITDLPQSVTDTLRLFENIHINPATLFLLQNAFNMTIPEFKTDFVVGSGYSLVSDSTLPSKIFQTNITTNQPSDLLFRVPDTYHIEVLNQLDNQIQVFSTKEDFIKGRIKSLGLNDDAVPLDAYKSSPSEHPGFNLISLSENSSEITWDSLTATVDYHTFHIGLSSNAKFTNDFLSLLEQLETLNLTDSDNVGKWKHFFNLYGTHVVIHAFGGGSIIVKTTLVNDESGSLPSLTNSEKIAKLSETMANIMQELANELIGKDAIYEPPEGVSYEFFQKGGDHTYYWSNFSELDDTKNIDKWKDSLKYEPIVLSRRLQLVPISAAVNELTGNQNISFMIEEAAGALFNASLVYIPVQRIGEDNLESRDRLGTDMSHQPGDFESMREFANMFKMITDSSKEMQQNMIRLMAESQEKQQHKEAQWQQEMLLLKQQEAEEDRVRREQERYDKEMQLQRDALEMQRIAQENALRAQIEQGRQQAEMQQRMMMAELQSKNEQTLLTFLNAENDRRTQIALNKKSWWDKTLDFFRSATSQAAAAAPLVAMAG